MLATIASNPLLPSEMAPLLPPSKGQFRHTIRLLHSQHLDKIWIGQNQYRLPLAPLSKYPEPWC